jgi:hypothetical protein
MKFDGLREKYCTNAIKAIISIAITAKTKFSYKP